MKGLRDLGFRVQKTVPSRTDKSKKCDGVDFLLNDRSHSLYPSRFVQLRRTHLRFSLTLLMDSPIGAREVSIEVLESVLLLAYFNIEQNFEGSDSWRAIENFETKLN